jgi:hypothetical protein
MTTSSSAGITPFLANSRVFSEDASQFLIQMTSIYSNIARAINVREIAAYQTYETQTGQQWYNPNSTQVPRLGFRTTYSFGAIATGASTTIAHGLIATMYTSISGTCITDYPDNRPIPYADVSLVTNQISVTVDSTNINISNGSTGPNILSGQITLEYLKD